MGINTTKKDANKQAEKDLEEKLRLEKELILDLIVFFSQLAEDYRVVYSSTGKILTLNESYIDELQSLLKKNYRNVSNVFSNTIQKALEDNIDLDQYEVIPEKQNALQDKIAYSLGAYLLLRSNNITPRITETIQNEMKRKTEEYIIDQAKKGIAVKQAEIANKVSENLKNWGENHSKIIATTEVQTVAEESKYVENAEINDLVQSVDIQKGSRKVWITAGDEKVRTSHQAIDGVSIDAEDLFITGAGSRMRYAGDMENGADLSDVINCRCSTVYKYDTEIVKIYRNTIYRRK